MESTSLEKTERYLRREFQDQSQSEEVGGITVNYAVVQRRTRL